jgi:hypothetical protein
MKNKIMSPLELRDLSLVDLDTGTTDIGVGVE